MKKDANLEALRENPEFKRLLTELMKGKEPEKK
jgi:hypothetical protein